MPGQWIVLKFGGTSVAGRTQWETIAELAQNRRNEGCRVLLVCSAVAGVTNLLQRLAESPRSGELLDRLLDRHRELGAALGLESNAWLEEGEQLLRDALHKLDMEPGPMYRAELMALGEWLSTRAGAQFLHKFMEIDWVDARQALEVVEERNLSAARRWLSASCHAGPDHVLNREWSELKPVLITQGFIARVEDGRTALLGRGGSDTSAALFAGRLNARRLEIWSDVPGLFSADPRCVPNARLLRHVGYQEALEMAAGGARVVHPRCIRAAAETGTPLEIRDMARQDLEGTRIDHSAGVTDGVKTITCKQGMAVLLLRNLDARHQVGFLADVFTVFRERGVSVDLVATSETTTTVAINRELNHLQDHDLEKLQRELARHCTVEAHPECVCVSLVGQGVRKALSRLGGVMELFHDHPLLMASMSANDLCLSLLVEHGLHEQLVRQAHDALIPDQPIEPFGSTWQQVRAA